MMKINKYINRMGEEVNDAKMYAEKYIECKANNNMTWANKFKEMSQDEMKHASYIYEMATQEMDNLIRVYTPTQEMQEHWDASQKKYIENMAYVKQMLSMA